MRWVDGSTQAVKNGSATWEMSVPTNQKRKISIKHKASRALTVFRAALWRQRRNHQPSRKWPRLQTILAPGPDGPIQADRHRGRTVPAITVAISNRQGGGRFVRPHPVANLSCPSKTKTIRCNQIKSIRAVACARPGNPYVFVE